MTEVKVARPTGQEQFDAMTKEQQDEKFGPEVAQMLRDGKITLADLVSRTRSPAEGEQGFIVLKPQKDLEG